MVKHVEDLQSRLVDGEDHCAIRLSQFVQMGQQIKWRSGIETYI